MTKHLTAAILAITAASAARAHEGHGLPGSAHWHATDSVGWIVAAVLVAAAAWWLRRK